jgi:hypothetical protein
MLFAAVRIPVVSASYSCSGGCYALEQTDYTDLGTTILGAHIKIDTVHISCSCVTYKFIDNEMWLQGSDPVYFVETGYTTSGDTGNQVEYFWGYEYRDGSGKAQRIWQPFAGSIPSGDYGSPATYWAYKTGGWNSSQFQFNVINTHTNYSVWQNNNFIVNSIVMGQELVGTNGASAPNARFSYRYAMDANHNSIGIYGNYYQPYPPSNPPYLGYISGDTDFYTHCC